MAARIAAGFLSAISAATLVYFFLMLFAFAFALHSLTAPQFFELHLFIDSLSKPIAVTPVALWLYAFGMTVDRPKLIAWAKKIMIIYVVVAVGPYFTSLL